MENLERYDINTKYRDLVNQGFTIEATTARANSGTLILILCDEVLAKVEIKTNGRGTKEILKALPTAKRRTHLDVGLKNLYEAAKSFVTGDLTSQGRYMVRFVASYQAAVTEHADKACNKVFTELQKQPTAPLSKLYTVFTNEILASVAGGQL